MNRPPLVSGVTPSKPELLTITEFADRARSWLTLADR